MAGEKNAVLEILRCFFVDPNAHGRTKENASRTQTDTMKVQFGLFNWQRSSARDSVPS